MEEVIKRAGHRAAVRPRRALSIRAKLIGAFSVLFLLLIGLGAIALERVGTLRETSSEIAENWLPSVRWVALIRSVAADHRIGLLRHILNSDEGAMATIEREMEERLKRLGEIRRIYEPVITSAEERQIYERFAAAWEDYLREAGPVLELSRKNDFERARDLQLARATPVYNQMQQAIQQLVELNMQGGRQASARATQARQPARLWILVIAGGALLRGPVMALLIVRSI